jgi:peptidyl-prolyl cis-trans isomerase D
MLQALREKTSGWIAFIILGAVSIPFAFFGINNYFSAQVDTYVAKVDDAEITPGDYRQRWDEYRNQLRAQMGEGYDPAYFEQVIVKRQFLDRLIDEQVLLMAAEEAGTAASKALLRNEIAAIPQFQTDGAFDSKQYQLQLNRARMTVPGFEERMRRDLSARELPGQVSASAIVTDADVDAFLRLRDQARDLRYVAIPAQAPESGYEPKAEDVQAYYDVHRDEFMTAEQLSLEYIELEAADMKVDVEPAEADLRARYDEQKTRFVVPEQRQASHLLVRVGVNDDAEAQRRASEMAQDLAAQARAGKDFAALAREHSDDVGSKGAGGDLGWTEKGGFAPAFEEALFTMDKGAISDPVKTEEGYHVIWLRDVQPERAKSFDEVRGELAREYLDSERERLYTDQQSQLVDELYKDQGDLAPAAKALGLEIKRTELFGRGGGTGIAANPAVLKAAFSDAVLAEGNASDTIDIEPNHIVVIKVDEHQPSTPRPLEEVRAEIVKRMQAERGQQLTRELADKLEAKLSTGTSLDELATGAGSKVEVVDGAGRSGLNTDPALVAEAFKLARPSGDAPTRAMVELAGPRYMLVEVTKVVDGDPAKADAAARESARQTLLQGASYTDYQSFLDAERRGHEITIAEERL